MVDRTAKDFDNESNIAPIQLLKKSTAPAGSCRGAQGARDAAESSIVQDSDARRLWERDERLAGKSVSSSGHPDDGFMGMHGPQRGVDGSDSEADSVMSRREAPSFRVISHSIGPNPDQVVRSVEASGDVSGRETVRTQQTVVASNAQFVGQLTHGQHGVDVHQLPSDAQFLHQHIPPEACLQQPIFLVKLPHQQQMTQGNSQAPQALSFSPPCLLFS